ncbi:MAG TPA: alkaline phosphatase D family protein [Burkholderiales bacterium]|nr:alkaline phosphatase D family protein [Burkholderiales bacterium]
MASCQRYEDGYYTAYRHMAEEDLDLVIHVGDYIYHARFPWAVVWDDHEVENDYAGLVGGNGPRPEFAAQRAAAYQAYYEHMPLRVSALPQAGRLDLHRRLRYGELAEIFLLDTRQYRTDQPCGGTRSRPCAARATARLRSTAPGRASLAGRRVMTEASL